MRFRLTAGIAAAVIAALPAAAVEPPSCPGLHVQVLDIRNSTGTVDCALFESPEGFPVEFPLSATHY